MANFSVTRAPTSDESETGTWSGGSVGNRFAVVDDHPDSTGVDELTHGTTAGRLTFGYSTLSIPATAFNIVVFVDYYDYKNGSQIATVSGAIKVGGSYFTAGNHTPGNGSATRAVRLAQYSTNPATVANWTPADINGTGANPLQAFGWSSNDASPTLTFSSIQLRVDYDDGQISGSTVASALVGGTTRAIGTIVGSTVAAALLGGAISAVGTIAGSGHASALAAGTGVLAGPLSGSGFGAGLIAGGISAVGALAGSAAGAGLLGATPSAIGALAGSGAGAGLLGATPSAVGTLSGSAAGSALVGATASAVGVLSGSSAGSGLLGATPSAVGALAGASSGASAGTGGLSALGSIQGSGAGSALAAAAPVGAGQLAGAGFASALLEGPPTAAGQLAGAGFASALPQGSPAAIGQLSGSAAASALAAAAISGPAALQASGMASAFGLAEPRGAGLLEGFGAGSSLVATDAGEVSVGALEGFSAGSSASSAELLAIGSLAGEAFGFTFASGALVAAGQLAGAGFGSSLGMLGASHSPGFFEQLGNAIRNRFASELPSVPVQYANSPLPAAGSAPWVSLRIESADQRQTEFGSGNGYRAAGKVEALISSTLAQGWAAASLLAVEIAAVFRQVTASGVVFGTPSMRKIGKPEEGMSWQVLVEMPFRKDRNEALQEGSAGYCSFFDIEAIVNDRFETEIASAYSVSTQYDNMPAEIHPAGELWVRFSVVLGDSVLIEGDPRPLFRTHGIATAQIFSPGPGTTGEQAALELADRIDAAFKAVRDRGVLFKAPSVRPRGRAGARWQVDVICPFYAEEIS